MGDCTITDESPCLYISGYFVGNTYPQPIPRSAVPRVKAMTAFLVDPQKSNHFESIRDGCADSGTIAILKVKCRTVNVQPLFLKAHKSKGPLR